jgi:hypothetical protein
VTSSATVVTITSASGNSSGDASGGIPNSVSGAARRDQAGRSGRGLAGPPSSLNALSSSFPQSISAARQLYPCFNPLCAICDPSSAVCRLSPVIAEPFPNHRAARTLLTPLPGLHLQVRRRAPHPSLRPRLPPPGFYRLPRRLRLIPNENLPRSLLPSPRPSPCCASVFSHQSYCSLDVMST